MSFSCRSSALKRSTRVWGCGGEGHKWHSSRSSGRSSNECVAVEVESRERRAREPLDERVRRLRESCARLVVVELECVLAVACDGWEEWHGVESLFASAWAVLHDGSCAHVRDLYKKGLFSARGFRVYLARPSSLQSRAPSRLAPVGMVLTLRAGGESCASFFAIEVLQVLQVLQPYLHPRKRMVLASTKDL